ncbi:duffy binding protein 2 [Plasmodium ovale curtisi]|nr:duffy binding protein 2 [Plasmodium ovale curtisi]
MEEIDKYGKYCADGMNDILAKEHRKNGEKKIELFVQANDKNRKGKKEKIKVIKGTKKNDKEFNGKRTSRQLEEKDDVIGNFRDKIYTGDKYGKDNLIKNGSNSDAYDSENINNKIPTGNQSQKSLYDSREFVHIPDMLSSDEEHKVVATTDIHNDKIYTTTVPNYSFIDYPFLVGCKAKRNGIWDCNKEDVNEERICIPDRRIQLCIYILMYLKHNDYSNNLKIRLLVSLNSEIILLLNKWNVSGKFDNDAFCNDLRNDYADYGNVIKGTDMEGRDYSEEVELRFEEVFGNDDNGKRKRMEWWYANKEDIWNNVLSLVKERANDITIEECTKEPNFEEIPQFQRWIQEWVTNSYGVRDKKLKSLEGICEKENHSVRENGCNIGVECKKACLEYDKWKYEKKKQCYILLKKFSRVKDNEMFIQKGSIDTISKILSKVCEEVNKVETNSTDNIYNNFCKCKASMGFFSERECKNDEECKRMCDAYTSWIKQKIQERNALSQKFNIVKDTAKNAQGGNTENAPNFLVQVCKEFNWLDFEKIFDLSYIIYKNVCNCKTVRNTKFFQLRMEGKKPEYTSTPSTVTYEALKLSGSKENSSNRTDSSSTTNLSRSVLDIKNSDDAHSSYNESAKNAYDKECGPGTVNTRMRFENESINTSAMGTISNTENENVDNYPNSAHTTVHFEGNNISTSMLINRDNGNELSKFSNINNLASDGDAHKTEVNKRSHNNYNIIDKNNESADGMKCEHYTNQNGDHSSPFATGSLKERSIVNKALTGTVIGLTNINKEEEKNVEKHNFSRSNTYDE